AAGVAHEVNTPLTGISSYAQLLLKEIPDDDPKHALLKKMEMQTFRASHLVNNLLDFASNRHRNVERVDLPELVRATLSIHEDLLKGKHLAVHVGDLPQAGVKGNFYEMQQVLTNLLLNARDAVPIGGNIWIDVHRDGCKAILTVRDDGHGIPPELRDKIFTPLVTTKRAQGGTGLGLAISDRIVRAAGGTISAESTPGKGATFSVSLPLWQSTS
ncbi:MAG TPA: HAMP domain-containing sensor histidine kinase, partial [Thermoanaerobaculia bacterium]